MTTVNNVWKSAVKSANYGYQYESNPRDLQIREVLNYNYEVDMNEPVITVESRALNYSFMFAEAAWILEGRNDLNFITTYMKSYGRFSDDGLTLNGAYGPKFIDQISWAASELANDLDSRRCYINIWRERPGPSKDIPCTTGIQFIVRDNQLNVIVNMRSQDVVWGMPYDILTFSAIGKFMQVFLWSVKNIGVGLGKLYVRAGSLHIYEQHFEEADSWIDCDSVVPQLTKTYHRICSTLTPEDFVQNLVDAANDQKRQAA